MATENLILPRDKSALVVSGRQQIISQAGDLWIALEEYATDVVRFSMATIYNATETQIDDTINSGYECKITLGSGILQGIGKSPSRPKPAEQ